MNNVKAIVASGAMVMAAALGAGALIAWQQPSVAAPDQETQILVEYVDVPAAGAESVVEASPPRADEAPIVPEPALTEPALTEPVAALEEYSGEYEDDDEYEGGEDGD